MNSNTPPSQTPPVLRRRRWPFVIAVAALLLAFCAGLLLWRISSKKTPTVESVALTAFANQETRGWQTVPRGTQVCDRVTFICDGAIRTSGLRAARDGKTYPGAVLDVPVHRRGSRIHLLQSSENSGGAIAGAPYGRMVLHYRNGETRRFDFLFAVHGLDWMHNPRDRDKPVLDETTTVGWSETHSRNGFLIRFHHATFVNPLPGVEITSADFISPLHGPNLLLFGLTVDNDARPLAAPLPPGESLYTIPSSDKITITLQDTAGRTLPGAALAWTALAPRGQVDFPPMRADAQGRVSLEFQHGALRQIRYTASTAGGKTISGELQPDDTGGFASDTAITIK